MKNIKTITSLILFLKITALSSFGSPDYTGAGGGKLANVDMQNLLPAVQQVRDPEYDEYGPVGVHGYGDQCEGASCEVFADGSVHLLQEVILEGEGDVVGENIQHPNGNVFDQILLTGKSIKVQAKPGQITRVSFLDENEDIVQAEFSGAGDFTITLDPETFQPAALPARYNQDVKYVTGKPSIVVDGADASTYISLFTVGRLNAVNENLFPEGQEYDAKADVKLVEVTNCSEIGGMLMGNAEFSGKSGKVGIDARNVKVKQRVTFGDIDASGDAVPYLLFDEGAFEEGVGPGPMVAGGDLVQTNGAAIVVRSPGQVNPSFTGLPTLANFKSDDTPLKKVRPETLVKAKFKIENGENITPQECNCAQGGGLMFDDRYDAVDNPFPLDDGIKDFNYDDINYDSETGYYGKISRDDYEYSGEDTREGDVDKSVAMKVIAVPADHDGIDNDGDGEIDEEGEMFPVKENTQGEVTDSGFIVVPADHDGVDNDGDGEIDEEGEYEVVYIVWSQYDEGSEDENLSDPHVNDLRLNTEGQYVDADGNIVRSIVQVERTEYIRAEGPQEGGYPGGAHDDGLDNDGDGEIDEPGESYPLPPEDPDPLNHINDNDDEGSEDDTEEEETDDD